MIRRVVINSLILVILGIPGFSLAAQRTIHVELSYSGVASSYNLYQDGVKVCVSNTPTATTIDCNVEIGTEPITFVLTAVDPNGVESPQSAPYVLTPPEVNSVTGNYLPQANFTTGGTTGEAPFLVLFDGSGSSDFDGIISSYEWNFGDGNSATGDISEHTFTVPGTYSVLLTVRDDKGEAGEKTAIITVTQPAPAPNNIPIAKFSTVQVQQGTSLLQFDATASSDADGTIVNYAWNFGDGETAVGKIVEHEFKLAGDYTVILTVTDNAGATGTDTMIITVVDPPKAPNVLPEAAISASTEKRSLHFEWEYTGTDPGLVGFRLYQNSRQVCDVPDPTARQADCLDYVDNGLVRLWVTAYDQAGVESAPSGALTFDSTGLFDSVGGKAPLAIHFSAGTSFDPDGEITAYAWNFGDGTIAESLAVDHIFTIPGNYTVTLTVTDNSGEQSQTTTIIQVIDGTPPSAANASFSTMQDKSVTATLTASDTEGSPLTYRITKNATLGTATITNATTGLFTYVPKAGAFGDDSFSFKASDGTSDSNEAVVSVNIQKVNSAPNASGQNLIVPEDGSVTGTLSASDPDGDVLSFAILAQPLHGSVILDTKSGVFTYSPLGNYNGSDSFTFIVNDGTVDSSPVSVEVGVTAVNDAPIAQAVSLSLQGNSTIIGQMSSSDPDGDQLTYSFVKNGDKGNAVITNAGTGTFSYTPIAGASGQDTITYQVSDGQLSAENTVTLTIAPVNSPPTVSADYAEVLRRRTIAIPVLANDSDADGDELTVASVMQPPHGKAVVVRGKIAYKADPDFIGKVNFTYTVKDSNAASSTGIIVVTVK